ncbi:MAG: ATP-binding cassette domain-containing protein [Pseudomonadota bacterium]
MVRPRKITVRNLSFYYGARAVLQNASADFSEHTLTAITGPSGQGKSTFLTILNRLWEDIPGTRLSGGVRIRLNGADTDIYERGCHLPTLRRKVGMVFQNPNPLPMSIYKNVAFPLKLAGSGDGAAIEEVIETALRRVFLWDEVKDRLKTDARQLSGGQQQRLCIARALVLQPEVILLDEPTASLDAVAAEVIERLLLSLKARCTLLMVTHYLDQAQRVADHHLLLKDGQFFPQPEYN